MKRSALSSASFVDEGTETDLGDDVVDAEEDLCGGVRAGGDGRSSEGEHDERDVPDYDEQTDGEGEDGERLGPGELRGGRASR